MNGYLRLAIAVALCAAAWCVPMSSVATPILYDGFDPGISQPPWYKYPGTGHILEGSSSHVHSRPNAMVAIPNWRYAYTAYRMLPEAYDQDVYYSVWVRDDAVISPGLPNPPDNPNWSEEHTPDALIRLEDSNGFDELHLGTIGKIKKATDPQWPQNIYFSVYSTTDGTKLLAGPPTSTVPVRREPGYRKWMIRVKPYTGAKGDVEYYVDGQLVYSGFRASGPMGPAGYDRIGLGSSTWTSEYYWYDDVEFDYWPTPPDLTGVAQALACEDGEWVRLVNMVVDRVYPDSIDVSDGGGSLIRVYPARFAAPGDVVSVTGKLASSPGGRYIDALKVDRVTVSPLVTVDNIAEARALPDGTRVRLPERVVTASLGPVRFVQEPGDWGCGIKIRNIYEPLVGDKVVVEGQVMTVGPEKLIEAEKVTVTTHGNSLPKAVAVPNSSLYPPSVIPSGMVVVTTGKVVFRPDMWYPGWCEIRDGSQPADAPPVRVQLPTYQACPIVGDTVWVRGVSGFLVEDGGWRPVIYCRDVTDIRTILP